MIRVELPIRTVSEANRSEHWSKKAKRVKGHRTMAGMAVYGPRLRIVESWPITVTLTRVAPRSLDDDNLRGAFKAIRDGVADALRVKDNDPRITWDYAQEKGKPRTYGVRIEIRPMGPVSQ